MDEERPVEEAPAAPEQPGEEPLAVNETPSEEPAIAGSEGGEPATEVGDVEGEPPTVVSSAEGEPATIVSSSKIDEPIVESTIDETIVGLGVANDGIEEDAEEEGGEEDAGEEDAGEENAGEDDADEDSSDSKSPHHTKIIVGGIALIVLLIVLGLFLPPISLGERLGFGGDEAAETTETEQDSQEEIGVEGEFAVMVNGSAKGVKVDVLPQEEFLNGESDEEWSDAAAAIPADLTLTSDVYAIEYKEDAPEGSADLMVPAGAQPYQTLDLYGWDGQDWRFYPSHVADDGGMLSSAEGPLPQAFALMQTSPPATPAVAAEVLPTQSLPAAVLPFLTEVTAGTLTLGQGGAILGEVVLVPPGNYRQLMRVTNTGAVVDTVSLAMLLDDQTVQQQHIKELVDKAVVGNFDGVNLDYQGVDANHTGAFSAFVADLAGALHDRDLILALSLESPVLDGDQWNSAGQDWAALGQTADIIYAQTPLDPTVYDDNGEAQQIIEWATRQIDRRKLSAMTSVNAIDAVGETHREVDGGDALANFGELQFVEGAAEVEPGQPVEVVLSGSAGDLAWDPESLSYKYTYEQAGQPHAVWLGSEAVLNHRSRFANRYNLRGVAVRGLGDLTNASAYAAAVESYLGQAEAPQPVSAAIVWAVEDESGGVLASSSGVDLNYSWQAVDEPGQYIIRADFAQGDSVAALDSVEVSVKAKEEPTPTPEPTKEAVAEAVEEPTPTAEAATSSPASTFDPGDADAIANTDANVRNGPGLAYGIIGGISAGEKVTLMGRNDGQNWLQAELPDGTEGWIFAILLKVNESVQTSALSVVEVEAPVVAAAGGDGDGTAPSAPAAPPVIAPAAGGSFELGGQTHTLANPTLMSMAGMNWVKFQHKWGSGDSADAVAGRIQQAHSNGFKVLLSIPGSNAYPSNIDFNGYVEFLRGVAALGPDAIEVWNEENIDFEWPAGQIDPASYVNNMLAPAYNAIKSANPSVMVIGGAPAPTGFDNGTNAWSDSRYMAGVAAAGGGSYMDCIGVHHNAGATSPNTASGHPAGNDHYSWYFWPTLNMYYNSFGGSRPVCFTELGYLSGEDLGGVPSRFSWAANTSVGQHAQWLAEAASLAANSGKVRMMIIFNVDFTHWGEDPQAGYAMLRPNGSCPSCGLLGSVMGR